MGKGGGGCGSKPHAQEEPGPPATANARFNDGKIEGESSAKIAKAGSAPAIVARERQDHAATNTKMESLLKENSALKEDLSKRGNPASTFQIQ